MRRELAVSKLCLATTAAVMFGAGAIVCGCGGDDGDRDDDGGPANTGSISGTVTYSGSEPGMNTLIVIAYPNNDLDSETEYGPFFRTVTAAELNGGVSFSLTGLPDGTYAMLAWWELDLANGPGPGDATAIRTSVVVAGGQATSNVNLTLTGGSGGTGSITVSVDGGADVILGSSGGQLALGVYCTTSNPPIPALSTAVVAGAMGAAPMSMIIFDGNLVGTFDIAAMDVQLMYVAADDTMYGALGGGVGSGTVVVTVYGAVGERIEGTFDVIAHEFDAVGPTATTVNLTGSFSVVRQVDDYSL